jgi:hypothetical protein
MALTDLTRISTAGIATGTSLSGAILHGDAHFRGTNAGINSAIFDSSENELNLKDNVKLTFGDKSSGDMMIYHDGSHSHIFDNGTGDLRLTTGGQKIDFQKTGGEVLARFHTDGAVELRHDNSIKFQTTESGSIVTGILTATGFSGPLSNASGISTFYNLRVSNNLTVEGTTTTLDTNVTGVDRLEINANSNTNTAIVGIQSGTADIVNLFDGTTEVLTVKDGGDVGIGSEIPSEKLDVNGNIKASGKITAYDATSTSNQVRARIKATASDDDGRVGVYYGNTEIAALFGKWSGSAFSTGLNVPFEPFVVTGSSGAERLRITSDGKIGIGTDDPNGKTHIYESSAGSVTAATDANDLTLESSANVGMSLLTANNSLARIKFGDPDATNAGAFVYNHQNDKLTIITGTGNRMIIGSDMISGRTDYALARTVGGYTFRETNEGNERAGMHSNASNDLIFKTAAASEKLRIKSNGHTGIGTDDPLNRLHVRIQRGNSTGLTASAALDSGNNLYLPATRLENSGMSGNIEVGQLFLAGSTDQAQWLISCKKTGSNVGDFIFRTRTAATTSAERLRITNIGRVGIGTDDPDQKLTVFDGDQRCLQSGATTFRVDQNATGWNNLTNNTGPILAWDYKSGPGDLFYIGSGGNTAIADQMALVVSDAHGVKIGRSGYDGSDFDVDPNNEFFRVDISGNLTLTGTTGNSSPRFTLKHSNADVEGEVIRIARTDLPTIRYHSIKAKHSGGAASNYISFNVHDGGSSPYTSQAEVLRLRGDGKVGINNNSPTTQLDVTGSIRALSDANNNVVLTSTGSIELTRENGAFIDFATAGTEDHDCRIKQESNGLAFTTGGQGSANEKLLIASNGELTISGARSGNSIPDVSLKFNILNSNGDSKKATITATKTADVTSELIFSTTVSHAFAERLKIDSSGNLVQSGSVFAQTSTGNTVISTTRSTEGVVTSLQSISNPVGRVGTTSNHSLEVVAYNNPAFTVDASGGVLATTKSFVSKFHYNPGIQATGGWGTDWNTIIPGGTFNYYDTYVITAYWQHNYNGGDAGVPYLMQASFLFSSVSVNNSTGGNVEFVPFQTAHVGGGTHRLVFRFLPATGHTTAGVQVKNPAGFHGTYGGITVKAHVLSDY